METNPDLDLKNMEEAAAYLHTPVPTLRTWINKGTAPRSGRFGKRRMFLKSDLDAFILSKFDQAK